MPKIRPISPEEVTKKKREIIPDVVFSAFNELISRNFDGNRAVVYQRDVIAMLKKAGIDSQKAYDNHWLDIEDLYREQGWSVEYDKPAYCESYEPHFIFKRHATTRR